jgi:hypothetical protein
LGNHKTKYISKGKSLADVTLVEKKQVFAYNAR